MSFLKSIIFTLSLGFFLIPEIATAQPEVYVRYAYGMNTEAYVIASVRPIHRVSQRTYSVEYRHNRNHRDRSRHWERTPPRYEDPFFVDRRPTNRRHYHRDDRVWVTYDARPLYEVRYYSDRGIEVFVTSVRPTGRYIYFYRD